MIANTHSWFWVLPVPVRIAAFVVLSLIWLCTVGVWLWNAYINHVRNRPYDWEIDGECDNASKPRILAWDEIPPEWFARHARMN